MSTIGPHSPAPIRPTHTQPQPASCPSNPDKDPGGYDLPKVGDLFDGSKPNFGRVYDKYISATQVPQSFGPNEYYDAEADRQTASAYYGELESLSDPKVRNAKLRELLTDSHTPHPKGYHYVIAKHLYTDVDRHPDGTVRSIYNKEPVKVLKYPDISLDTLAENDLSAIAGACVSSPEVLGAWLSFQRGAASLNCEHVVPQSFFGKKEPMRSDLHHLFACNIGDNSRRGATPYGKFVPPGGKGEVARATLYFMMRYPEVKTPYNERSIEMFKQWSADDPPDDREMRRNREVQKIQGNRNPFIDHPEWVQDLDSKSL